MRKIMPLLVLVWLLSSPSLGEEQLKAAVGQKFVITIASNPTTGYSWQLAKPLDGKMLKFLGSKYYADKADPQMVGVGGEERWSFKALKKGKTRISFKYVRPWEKGIAPADTREYLILIR